jgi:hypothetical protein
MRALGLGLATARRSEALFPGSFYLLSTVLAHMVAEQRERRSPPPLLAEAGWSDPHNCPHPKAP